MSRFTLQPKPGHIALLAAALVLAGLLTLLRQPQLGSPAGITPLSQAPGQIAPPPATVQLVDPHVQRLATRLPMGPRPALSTRPSTWGSDTSYVELYTRLVRGDLGPDSMPPQEWRTLCDRLARKGIERDALAQLDAYFAIGQSLPKLPKHVRGAPAELVAGFQRLRSDAIAQLEFRARPLQALLHRRVIDCVDRMQGRGGYSTSESSELVSALVPRFDVQGRQVLYLAHRRRSFDGRKYQLVFSTATDEALQSRWHSYRLELGKQCDSLNEHAGAVRRLSTRPDAVPPAQHQIR